MKKNGRGQKIKAGELDNWIGHLFKQEREEKQRFTNGAFNQDDVAKKIGSTLQQYQKYENGKNKVSISMLYKIFDALEMTEKEITEFWGKVGGKYKELNK